MTDSATQTPQKSSSRQFKGLSLEQRQNIRREKFIAAGLQAYGTHGFFSVTIKDICKEAKLTERYFYESFKRSEELFKVLYLQLITDLQLKIIEAVMQINNDPQKVIRETLTVLFKILQDDPRVARILFIDAVLVHELHGDTIHESYVRFDQTILNTLNVLFPDQFKNQSEAYLVATGLNGYVIQIAMRWVTSGFEQPFDDVLSASCRAFDGIYSLFHQNKS